MLNNHSEFLSAINKITEGNNSDEVLDILDYASKIDTSNSDKITELETKIQSLETEKTDLENSWREKYRNAFFNPPTNEDRPAPQQEKKNEKSNIQIKDLFKPKQ